jgi:uncharacterized membrane protein
MTDVGIAAKGAMRLTPRWILALLFASLAVNLLVFGSIAGAVWRVRAPQAGTVVIPNLMGYASTLPTERRKEVWELIADERNHVRPFRRQVRAAREETIKALAAEPFDKQRFLEAQARQSETENRARAAVQQLYVKIAETLTPAERRAFPAWREFHRHPVRNVLDEPDHSAGESTPK